MTCRCCGMGKVIGIIPLDSINLNVSILGAEDGGTLRGVSFVPLGTQGAVLKFRVSVLARVQGSTSTEWVKTEGDLCFYGSPAGTTLDDLAERFPRSKSTYSLYPPVPIGTPVSYAHTLSGWGDHCTAIVGACLHPDETVYTSWVKPYWAVSAAASCDGASNTFVLAKSISKYSSVDAHQSVRLKDEQGTVYDSSHYHTGNFAWYDPSATLVDYHQSGIGSTVNVTFEPIPLNTWVIDAYNRQYYFAVQNAPSEDFIKSFTPKIVTPEEISMDEFECMCRNAYNTNENWCPNTWTKKKILCSSPQHIQYSRSGVVRGASSLYEKWDNDDPDKLYVKSDVCCKQHCMDYEERDGQVY